MAATVVRAHPVGMGSATVVVGAAARRSTTAVVRARFFGIRGPAAVVGGAAGRSTRAGWVAGAGFGHLCLVCYWLLVRFICEGGDRVVSLRDWKEKGEE